MAQELDDGEFWLPSEFLTDDDLFMDFKTYSSMAKSSESFGSSLGFNSGLCSPVESVMGSTETESDEDEFISGLTRKMAHSTIGETNSSTDFTSKGLKLSGSPQSTLCGFKPGSGQSSRNSASRVSSPPESKDAVCWDLLYAAAGEVARMRMTEETAPFRSTKLFAPPPKPTPATVSVKNPNPPSTYYSNHALAEAHLAFLQLQANNYQRMKQHQMMKSGVWRQGKMEYHQFQNGGGNINGEVWRAQGLSSGDAGRTQGLSTAAWPTLQQSQQQQQQGGSGMRAVFLGETGAKKERTGTGVFLPRRIGTVPAESRKKPGCSTVLLPDRVVHTLNLNLESVEAQPHLRCNRNFIPEYDTGLNQRNSGMFPQQRRSQIPQRAINQELRLPQEWTY